MAPDPRILDLVMAALDKDDFPVTEAFATKFLVKYENKLLPTIKAIKENIQARETKLHNSGRISVPFERIAAYQMVEMYNSMKNIHKAWSANTRDTILQSLELEEQALQSTDPDSWKMLFSLKHAGFEGKKEGEEHAKQMHAGEKRYREERAKAWTRITQDSQDNNKKFSAQQIEGLMQKWEDDHAAPGTFGRSAGGVGSSYRRAYITPEGDPIVGDSDGATLYDQEVDVDACIDSALQALEAMPPGTPKTTNSRYAKPETETTESQASKDNDRPIKAMKTQVSKDIKGQSKSKASSASLNTPAAPRITVAPSSPDPDPKVLRLIDPQGKHPPRYYTRSDVHPSTVAGMRVVEASKIKNNRVKDMTAKFEAMAVTKPTTATERKMHDKLMKSLPADAMPIASTLSIRSEDIGYDSPTHRVPLMALDQKYDARLLGKVFFDSRCHPLVYNKHIPDVMFETDGDNTSTVGRHRSKAPVQATVQDDMDADVPSPDRPFEIMEEEYARKFEEWEQERLELESLTKQQQAPSEFGVKRQFGKVRKVVTTSPSIHRPRRIKSPLHATVEDASEEDTKEGGEEMAVDGRLDPDKLKKANTNVEPARLAAELAAIKKNDTVGFIIARYREEVFTPSQLGYVVPAATEVELEVEEFDSILPILERDKLLSEFYVFMNPFLGYVSLVEPSEEDILLVMSKGVTIRVLAKTLIALCGGRADWAADLYKDYIFVGVYAAFLTHSKKTYRCRELEHFAVDIEIFEWANRFLEKSLSKRSEFLALVRERILANPAFQARSIELSRMGLLPDDSNLTSTQAASNPEHTSESIVGKADEEPLDSRSPKGCAGDV